MSTNVAKPSNSDLFIGPPIPDQPFWLPTISTDFRSRVSSLYKSVLPGSEPKYTYSNIDLQQTANITQNALNYILPRFDGLYSSLRKGNNNRARSILYTAASAQPYGVYGVIGLGSPINRLDYGWGNHGRTLSNRQDFTIGSNIRTQWDTEDGGKWIGTRSPLELGTLFRGDKVSVIDYGKRKLGSAYKYNPRIGDDTSFGRVLSHTRDFIKFFFTGPLLHNNSGDLKDDIMTFRASITSLSDTFSPNWTAQQMIGRADPNYIYTGFSRDLSLDFVVHATSRDELKPIWRKLNALAGYTTPRYLGTKMQAPWMRITIGDLFRQQPVIIENLSYTLHDTDTTWEINIEDDATNMEVPHRVSVSMTMKMISDYIPQLDGTFYTLTSGESSKNFDTFGIPKQGSYNWLSDRFRDNVTNDPNPRKRGKIARAYGEDVEFIKDKK